MTIRKREGFEGQVLHVIPRPILERALQHPLVAALTPTDIGWYPVARYHYCERENGAQEHILILCIDGTGWYEIDGLRYLLQPNQALVIPKGTPHIYGATDHAPWSIHWVHFAGSAADYYVQQLPVHEFSLSVSATTTRRLIDLFQECCTAYVASFVIQRLIYSAQTLHHLLGCLFFDNPAFSPTLQTSRFHSLETTIAFLHHHIESNLTLEAMAGHANLSVSHFSRLFREQTGYSPLNYFIHLKMQRACVLLSVSSKTIREISYEMGYDDPYYFSRLFKKVIGLSPSEYRQGQVVEEHAVG
jgi:AraC family transcriptional regulator, arabinose operon regulatory protein